MLAAFESYEFDCSVSIPIISIIDDDEPTRSAVAALMRAKGFSPSTYESAEGFLDARAHEVSQCVITDIFMPGINGIELKRRLNHDSCAVPVIMISARLEDRLESEALASGAFCVLRKPFKAQALIQCVERALRR
jgi:FixJ family two-component response regulator